MALATIMFMFAAVPVKAPELTKVESLALQTLQQEFYQIQQAQQKATKDLAEFQKEVETQHPGYRLDISTLKLIPVETKSETKPEVQKGK